MLDHTLRVAICHSITRRAHLAGAEAAELEAQHLEYVTGATSDAPACLGRAAIMRSAAAAARRRYWREVSAAARLSGRPWPEAEALGVESNG
jgi:hypothetical protein